MNPDTGEIKNFEPNEFKEAIRRGWIGWSIDELVEVKGCCFRVEEINIDGQTITLKAISKKMTKGKS